MRALLALVLAATSMSSVFAQDPVRLYAAGSLRAAMNEIAAEFERTGGIRVQGEYGPSGLLRERIEKGEPAEVFASANMTHPQTLARRGKGGPVAMFARNRLCGLAAPGVEISSATLLERMLDPTLKLGTSTPKADPSGDYAWKLFERAEKLEPGAREALSRKALKLTGGPESPPPPEGRNAYAHVVSSGQADLFLTYCTNAVLAQKEVADLQIIAVPEALAVGADYGITVVQGARPQAAQFALFVLSVPGQEVLARYGFTPVTLP